MSTPDLYSKESLIATGLTEDEAKLLSEWVIQGKPGIAASKTPALASMFVLGFSCAELAAQFPAYPLPVILYESVRGNWRALKNEFEIKTVAKVGTNAAIAKLDSVQLLSEISRATAKKWREELLQYLTNPESERAPDFLPDSLAQFKTLTELLKSLTETKEGERSPIVNVNVGAGASVRVVNPVDVKASLLKETKPI